jgi:hypothetical protein
LEIFCAFLSIRSKYRDFWLFSDQIAKRNKQIKWPDINWNKASEQLKSSRLPRDFFLRFWGGRISIAHLNDTIMLAQWQQLYKNSVKCVHSDIFPLSFNYLSLDRKWNISHWGKLRHKNERRKKFRSRKYFWSQKKIRHEYENNDERKERKSKETSQMKIKINFNDAILFEILMQKLR